MITFPLAAATPLLPKSARAQANAPEPAKLKGNINHSACKWCYDKKVKFDDLCAAAKDIGLVALDLLQPTDFATAKKYGLVCSMVSNPTGKTAQGTTVGGITRAFNRTEHHDTLVELYTRRIGDTAAAGFENLICFSGNGAFPLPALAMGAVGSIDAPLTVAPWHYAELYAAWKAGDLPRAKALQEAFMTMQTDADYLKEADRLEIGRAHV